MDKLLTEKQAGELLGWSTATLQNRRWKGQPPSYVRLGRSIRYRIEDIEAFLDEHTVEPRQHEEASR